MEGRVRICVCYQAADDLDGIEELVAQFDRTFDVVVLSGDEEKFRDREAGWPLDEAVAVLLLVGARWLDQVVQVLSSRRQDPHVGLVVEALTRELPVVVVCSGVESLTEFVELPDELAALVRCEAWYVDRLDELDADGVVRRLLELAAAAPLDAVEPHVEPVPEPFLHENVQFTVYRPRTVRPQQWYDLLAFAHLAERRPDAPPDEPDPLEQVREQAERLLGDQVASYDDPHSDSRFGVPHDGEITFLPEMDGVTFNPERRVFRWQEDVHREQFRMRADASLAGRSARGRMRVFLGVVILAEVDLAIRVDHAATVAAAPAHQPPAADHARPYRKIFASYAHADEEIVRQFELLAATMGDEYLRDVTRLRSGSDWDDALLRMIDDADVFQLFWSWRSMQSQYVQREWQYALSLGRPHFVRPTYWEDPLPASPSADLPPEALRRLHFSRLTALALAQPQPMSLRLPMQTSPPSPLPAGPPGSLGTSRTHATPGRRRRGPLVAALAVVGSGVAVAATMLGPSTTMTSPPPSATHTATSGPSVGSGSPSYPDATSATSATSAPMPLEALVPDEIASTCRTYRAERQGLAKGLSDALLCNRSGGFGPARVLYFRYVDRAALLAAFNWLTGSTYVRGPCEAGGQEASYRTTESGLVVGVLRCYGVNRLRILAWTHEDLRVLAVAEDELLEFGVLAQWWQTAGPYLDPDRLPRSFLAG